MIDRVVPTASSSGVYVAFCAAGCAARADSRMTVLSIRPPPVGFAGSVRRQPVAARRAPPRDHTLLAGRGIEPHEAPLSVREVRGVHGRGVRLRREVAEPPAAENRREVL